MDEVGTVISSLEGPSPTRFSFVVREGGEPMPVRKDQFVKVDCEEGTLIARVVDLRKTNRYFARAESVKEYERGGSTLGALFPTDRWEFLVGDAVPLGVLRDGVQRPSFPPSPGSKVILADNETLRTFLGIETDGIHIGSVAHHDLDARLNLTRLFQKHIAILALSGAGKSYLTTVLMEELLSRPAGKGRVALVVLDGHGEYTSLGQANDPVGAGKVTVVGGDDYRIAVPKLSAFGIAEYLPKMSSAQRRELSRVISRAREELRGKYDLTDLIELVRIDESIHENIQTALIGWLNDLNATGIFAKKDRPSLKRLVKPGKAVILDMSPLTNLRAKQIIVTHVSRTIFKLRQRGEVCPYVQVVEEAHNYVPEGESRELALSRSIIQTIAREGRKFYAGLCLISQRPIKLSTTALSQCNTHIILRVTNPYDLDHIGRSSEGISREVLNTISSLRVGEALVVGAAVNYPAFIKVRRRRSSEPSHARGLEDAASDYENGVEISERDVDAFM